MQPDNEIPWLATSDFLNFFFLFLFIYLFYFFILFYFPSNSSLWMSNETGLTPQTKKLFEEDMRRGKEKRKRERVNL